MCARYCLLLLSTLAYLSSSAQEFSSEDTYILATGRRLPYLYSISLSAALDPANNNTSNAIISRNQVALPHLDGRLLGDPANLVVSEDGDTVYVINHHGSIDNAEFRQHGGRGQIAVIDVQAALQPENNDTANALLRNMDSGGFGAIGTVLLPDLLVVNNAENNLSEDGGNRIGFVDRRIGGLRHMVELALGSPEFDCEDYPVPYESPYGPPKNLAVLAPDSSFGCFPNPNGLAMGRMNNGNRYLFTANGGTSDVSVVDLEAALRGEAEVERQRLPNHPGAWGITATPDGRHIIVAHGGRQDVSQAGNTVAVLDVDRAVSDPNNSELARIRVGTDDPDTATHPLIPSVTPDGRELIVPNLRADNVSIVDLDSALAGNADAEVSRISLTHPNGGPVRPKGTAITADGRYAAISAGPGSLPYSDETGLIFIIDLAEREVVGIVSGVGNDPYNLAFVYQ
ncbi:MAG: hypothetical protein RL839_05505 [Gammaproteobacteria bacterium]